MKFVTFVQTPERLEREQFQRWFAQEHLPALLKASPSLRGCVIRRRVEPPDGIATMLLPTADSAKAFLSYDIVQETWFPSSEDFRREVLPVEKRFRMIGSRHSSYSVMPSLQKDPRIAEAGPRGKRPEVTFIALMKWAAGVTPEAAQQQYRDHIPIALRNQPALTKYEQHIVVESISRTPGTPTFDAFGDFSIRTMQEMARWLPTEEENVDVSEFVGQFHVTFLSDAEFVEF
jgi:hypothetical protein